MSGTNNRTCADFKYGIRQGREVTNILEQILHYLVPKTAPGTGNSSSPFELAARNFYLQPVKALKNAAHNLLQRNA